MKLMTRVCKTERMNVERILARVVVLLGGAFWVIMAMATNTAQKYLNLNYENVNVSEVLGSALQPFALVLAVFVVGMFFEYLAASLLFSGAIATVVYGVLMRWELGIWITVGVFFISPMLISGLLFVSAARMQRICELEEAAN